MLREAPANGESAPQFESGCDAAGHALQIQPSAVVESVHRYSPGDIATDVHPGDVILIRSRSVLGWLIRAFGWMRHRGDERRYAYWSHAAVIVSAKGRLVEVHVAVVGLCDIEKYRPLEFHHVRLALPEAARLRAARYAYSCLRQPYGIGAFLLLALAIVLDDSFRVPDKGAHGCVALVVRALQQAGLAFDRHPADMTPADLARNFGVLP
jgi:hypothetical protein